MRHWLLFALVFATVPAAGAVEPVRESAYALESVRNPSHQLTLGIKRYPKPGAQPVLLVHGLSQNDRIWDSPIVEYNFARFLHAQGFDVWIGNLRGAGTPGYVSDKPDGPERWTIEHHAAYDVPALVQAVVRSTRRRPFLVGHSLAAWAFSGYLSGLVIGPSGPRASPALARLHQSGVRGVITIAGVYNLWWPKSLDSFARDPIRDERDFYQSNYELELAARTTPLLQLMRNLDAVPLDWIGWLFGLPVGDIPYIGSRLEKLFRGLTARAIETPILSMLYYAKNADPEMVRLHAEDGMDDISPWLLEQFANAVRDRELLSHYPSGLRGGARPKDAFSYGEANRSERSVPLLFIAGGRDRLANLSQVRRDGFEAARSADKSFIGVEEAGHLDIINGRTAATEVMAPVARWMRERM